jgi:hypothetical protein
MDWFRKRRYEADEREAVEPYRYEPNEEDRRGHYEHERRQRNLEMFLLGVNDDGSYLNGRTSPSSFDENGYTLLTRVRHELNRNYATGAYAIDNRLLDRIAEGIPEGDARNRFDLHREQGDFGDGVEASPYYRMFEEQP